MILDLLKRINLDEQITTHFKWKEFLYLHKWNMYVYPDNNQKYELFNLALKLEEIRQLFGCREIFIDSGLRPHAYDNFIKNKPITDGHGIIKSSSRHVLGKAADVRIFGIEAEAARKILIDHLNKLQIRIELDVDWLHIDTDWKKDQLNVFSR